MLPHLFGAKAQARREVLMAPSLSAITGAGGRMRCASRALNYRGAFAPTPGLSIARVQQERPANNEPIGTEKRPCSPIGHSNRRLYRASAPTIASDATKPAARDCQAESPVNSWIAAPRHPVAVETKQATISSSVLGLLNSHPVAQWEAPASESLRRSVCTFKLSKQPRSD